MKKKEEEEEEESSDEEEEEEKYEKEEEEEEKWQSTRFLLAEALGLRCVDLVDDLPSQGQ